MGVPNQYFNTYSIVARDPVSGNLGIAVQTHQMCVGAIVPWIKSGVGAIATQASTNISFGPLGLSLLEEGISPVMVVNTLVASDEGAHSRQFAILDSNGNVAAWTGKNCIAVAGHHIGEGFSVQANMMTNDSVIGAMSIAYQDSEGDLAQRMMSALFAAQSEGGDIRGMQSAALKIAKANVEGPNSIFRRRALYDLRVDEHPEPLEELARLVRYRQAQLINMRGHQKLDEGQTDEALELWEKARCTAPELEELSFWQAVAIGDQPGEIQKAVAILAPMLTGEERKERWVDLIHRIQDCGIIEREGAGDEIIKALETKLK